MTSDMKGKVCVVTGATSGIGRATAFALARRGATVVAVARDRARGEALVAEIRADSGNDAVELLEADLAVQASVRRAAAELAKRHPAIDVLINQAGLVMRERVLTVDGIETVFAVNHLAYFLLTTLLLPQLKAAKAARVINGTGGIYGAGDIAFDDLTGEKGYRWFPALAQSKLANVLFTYELARRLEGTNVTVNCFHPGGVKTGLGAEMGGVVGLIMRVARVFWMTPDEAAGVPVHLASAPELAKVTGRYFDRMKLVEKTGGKSNDRDLARRLWEVSEALVAASERHFVGISSGATGLPHV